MAGGRRQPAPTPTPTSIRLRNAPSASTATRITTERRVICKIEPLHVQVQG